MRAQTTTWVGMLLLAGTMAYAIAEDLTLTTYYPSPRGVYNELRTRGNVQVGTVAAPAIPATAPRLHVVQDGIGTAPALRVDDEANDATPVIVTADGNVGIGTTGPLQQLDVVGSVALPTTIDATSGVLYKGANRFIHNFNLAGTAGGNTFMGLNAGNFTMTGSAGVQGSYNTGIGQNALSANTTGLNNSAQGVSALQSNTSGSYNSAQGYAALFSNTTGTGNTAQGDSALFSNITGGSNTAQGQNALLFNTEGNNNTAQGESALRFNTIGNSNTAQGVTALQSNTTGNNNTAQGEGALSNNWTGSNNTVQGYRAGFGAGGGSNISNNTLLGAQAGVGLQTGGNNNILVGYRAGDNVNTGSSNIVLGYNIDAPSPTSLQTLNIGNLIFATGVDGTGTTFSTGRVGIGTTSPEAKLDVAGTVKIADGTQDAGRVLTSDASGNASWQPSSGFPKPDYDSGWIPMASAVKITPSSRVYEKTVTHDLNTLNTFVYLEMNRILQGGISALFYGLEETSGAQYFGFTWRTKTATTITVLIGDNENKNFVEIRVRMWRIGS